MAIGGNSNELACVYAALILHDDGLEISSDNIALILKAAKIEVEPYWPTLFAKLCKGKNVGDMLSAVGSAPAGGGGGGGGGGDGGGAAAPAAEAAAPEKAPEPEEEEEEMGFDLFD